ncbi:hypothetical protein [Streptomyces tsukubensis]|uniref:hypothetical protein n=1 Tax=Streptomyces tsukubensis TaxID=83656 RepID=UPI0015C320A3|nr:hypothetical protein [Streptomyces tsukubensis]
MDQAIDRYAGPRRCRPRREGEPSFGEFAYLGELAITVRHLAEAGSTRRATLRKAEP